MEHLTEKQSEDYCRRQLPAAELLSLTDHLTGCAACQRRIEGARNGDGAFFDLRSQVFEEATESISHLTMQQAAAYVDRDLSGEALQTVNDHLSHCHACLLAVTDLRAFRNEIAPSIDREYRPATTVPVKRERRSIFGFLPAPFRIAPAAAFALAVLLLATIGWLVWRSQQQSQPQIAENPVPSEPAPSVVPSPAASSPIVARLNDGAGVLTLDQQGKLSGADNLPASYQTLLKNALSTGRIEKSSQLQGLNRPSSSLMSSEREANKFHVTEPIGTVLLTDQPTFRWSAMPGATGYVVEVYDDRFNLVTSSPQLNTLNWTTSLPRGKIYSWQVKATSDEETVTTPRPPAPQANFRIVDQARATELAKARRAYGSSHLTLGLLYADAGLLREAEQEFRLLQKANPDSDLARNLLRHVQTLRR